jgi:dihydrofolate reductase
MRKVVLAMMTTLNGRVDDPDAWMAGVGDELYAEIDRVYESFDTVLVGRTTYEEMVAYWPGAESAEDAFSPTMDSATAAEINRRMARKMNAYKKFVFSGASEQRTLEWNNAELVPLRHDDDLAAFISALKAQSGADIHLAGGARLAQTAVRLGLVDEYRLHVHPVVSAGKTWFDQLAGRHDTELLSATAYPDGVVSLHYRPRTG